jgi:hypothetical protein
MQGKISTPISTYYCKSQRAIEGGRKCDGGYILLFTTPTFLVHHTSVEGLKHLSFKDLPCNNKYKLKSLN